ncbi:hypothetical protein CRN61_33420, partial [Vibrio vulnificus]
MTWADFRRRQWQRFAASSSFFDDQYCNRSSHRNCQNQSAFAWLFTNGGRLATQDGNSWKGGLSSAESQKGLSQLQEIWRTGSTTGNVTDTSISTAPYTAFNAEETGMFFGFNFHVKKLTP